MARSHSSGEKPWWFQVLQQLDSDGEDVDYPSDSELWSDTESIDLEHTDDETESDWSEHSSDEDFIDDSEVDRAEN